MQVDSFAFSVLLWEMITKEPPVRGQLHTIESPRLCPREVTQLIEQGLNRNPKQRPSSQEVTISSNASVYAHRLSSCVRFWSIIPFLWPCSTERYL